MEAENKIARSHCARPCPACKAGNLERIKRKGLLAWIPKSRHYQCTGCRSKFLLLLNRFIFRIGQVPGPIEIAVTALMIIATISTIYFACKLVVGLFPDE